jgi:hypothetical protein
MVRGLKFDTTDEIMMDGGDYEREPRPTPERVVATLLVFAWIIAAYHISGLPLAIRATLIFGFPLLFIWLPGVLVRIAGSGSRKGLDVDVPVSEFVIRLVGWAVIVGVPVAWLAFSSVVTRR